MSTNGETPQEPTLDQIVDSLQSEVVIMCTYIHLRGCKATQTNRQDDCSCGREKGFLIIVVPQ